MKQILIEKYIEPSEIKEEPFYIVHYWFDKYGDSHSFMGQPAVIYYNKNKNKVLTIATQYWYKKGKKSRTKNLPFAIYYDENSIDYNKVTVGMDSGIKITSV